MCRRENNVAAETFTTSISNGQTQRCQYERKTDGNRWTPPVASTPRYRETKNIIFTMQKSDDESNLELKYKSWLQLQQSLRARLAPRALIAGTFGTPGIKF